MTDILYKFQFQIKNKSGGADNSSEERMKIETENGQLIIRKEYKWRKAKEMLFIS